jgi:hypothetical protein
MPDTFGRDEQVKKIFRTFFAATHGPVLAQGLDPVTAEKYLPAILFPGNSRNRVPVHQGNGKEARV